MRQDSAAFADRSSDFDGAKGVVLLGDTLVALLRDDRPGLPWAGWWDLPGGGREGQETPAETFARETREEVGLDLGAGEWLWARAWPSGTDPGRRSWFLVVRLPARAARGIALGDEGQAWALMTPLRFSASPKAIPFLRDRVLAWGLEAARAPR